MSCLAEASSNYYWPDLHREVCKRLRVGYRHPTEAELTKFGRELFELTDKAALKSLRLQGIHHCFLALIMEQAGIGKDRNRIISEYLNWLVDNRSSLTVGTDNEWASQSVGTFIRTQPESSISDITQLGRVLSRIGAELMALVSALEARPNRVEIVGGRRGSSF